LSDAESPVDPKLLARLLRQRAEMGVPDLFLDTASREEMLRAARESGRVVPGPSSEEEGGVGGAAAAADTYDQLRSGALGCTLCGLAEGRTQVVFSDGVPDARVVVVGEAPGANEDRTGLPFVGAAGKLLDLMLASVDLSRERNAYICNVLKCRPPGNRNPLPAEIEACAPYLRRQIELVSPEVLLAVGSFAAQWLTGSQKPLGKIRGEVHSYQGVPVVVTYHPAALLRNRGWTRAAWDDLQLLRDVMDVS
jgi:DNA polymerase